METQQQNTNTIESTKRKAHTWLSKNSTDLLNMHRFDKHYKLDIPKYLIVKAMLDALCLDLNCGVDLTDSNLEKMGLYINKRDK